MYAGERWDIHGKPIATREEFEAYRKANLPSAEDRAIVNDVLGKKGGIAEPSADVYKELTHEKPSDNVLFRTTFGTKARSRYTKKLPGPEPLAAAAPVAVATASEPVKPSEDVPFWQLMEEAGA